MNSLRVFSWQGVAYQVDKEAKLCEVGPYVLNVEQYEANVATMKPGDESLIYRNATRLSTSQEWFDLTLAKAAHDYLETLMSLNRRLASGEPIAREAREFEKAMLYVADMFGDGRTSGYTPHMTVAYSIRVRSDIENRLMGEVGKVPSP